MITGLVIMGGILNLIMGMVVFFHSPRKRINYYFSIVCFATATLILFDTLFRFYPILFVLQNTYAVASMLVLFVFLWASEFLALGWSSVKKIIISLPAVLVFIVSYIDGFVIKSIEELLKFGYRGEFGPFFTLYIFVISFYILFTLYLLCKKYLVVEKVLRQQIKYVILGVSSYAFLAIFFSLILPNFFGVYDYTLLDAPSSVFLVVFISYAILKHNLFNIKVIITELLTFLIWVFVLIRIFVSETAQEAIINISLLTVLVISGILLILSVLKEVRMREEMERLAGKLKEANVRLKKLDEAKSEFISIASHQLRTPLTAIKGYSSMLLEGVFGKLPEKAKTPVDRIFRSSKSLVDLVGEFLNLSRIERGKMTYKFEKFDLKNLMDELAEEFKATAGKNIKITFEVDKKEDFHIMGDENKIRQIISNLIDNAVKYTSKGFVKIYLNKNPEKETVILKVKDSGMGMNEETLARIFEKFTRAREGISQIDTEGLGMGLYIAKKISEDHGGDIWAESDGEGKGSAFYVELPENFSPPAPELAGGGEGGVKNAKIDKIEEFIKGI